MLAAALLGEARSVGKGVTQYAFATLLVEADRVIPGKLNVAHAGHGSDHLNPQADDVLDDLSEYVLKAGGEVVVVPTERMPTRTGAAAIFRY